MPPSRSVYFPIRTGLDTTGMEADALRVVLARWTNAANRAKVAVS